MTKNQFAQTVYNVKAYEVYKKTLETSYESDFCKNELIIKFKDGALSNSFLESDDVKGNLSKVLSPKHQSYNKETFFHKFINYRLRKIVTRYKPSYSNSISRSGDIIRSSDIYNLMILEFNGNKDIFKLCKEINKFPSVEYAEPNFIIKINDSPSNDLDFENQRGFEQSSDADIDAQRAWDFTTGNYGIKVGVIDNGIDYHNIDLGDGIFGVHKAKVRGGWDFVNNDSDPDYTEDPRYSHGTEVAGIIGAIRNNSVGISGLAGGNGKSQLGVQLIALKVGPVECSDGTLRCLKTDRIIDAIIEGAMHTPNFGYGCHILNNSYGSTNYNESMRFAISIASKNNVVFAASKGNNNSSNLHYPSDYDENWVMSVGASDVNDRRAYFSNVGNGIDFVAPGHRNVFTTGIGKSTFESFSGTSAACPHVAGLSALILAEAKEQGISLHYEDIENLIKVSSEDVNGNGYDEEFGYGRINAGRALEMMNDPWELRHHNITGGEIVKSSKWYHTILYNTLQFR